MPSLPLYTPQGAHPDASHQVIAPGGYERWYFDAESDDGRVHVVATFSLGTADHPEYPAYVRRYRRYLRNPTRRRPPVPAEMPCVSMSIYESGRAATETILRVDPGEFQASPRMLDLSAGSTHLRTDADGSVRLHVGDAGSREPLPSADLLFRPMLPHSPREVEMPSSRSSVSHHRWILSNPFCAVEGTVRGIGGVALRFSGRGYHDHHYGTGPRGWMRGRVFRDGGVTAFCATGAGGAGPGPRMQLAEAQKVEVDGGGVRAETTLMRFEASVVPAVVELEQEGVRLEHPTVLSRAGALRRALYVASGKNLPGRTYAALCEWV